MGLSFAQAAPKAKEAGKDAFSQPFAFLDRESRRPFFTGNTFFNENWVAAPSSTVGRDGLGPLFQARSCSSCHRLDGRGMPPAGPDDAFVGLVIRLGKEPEGHPIYGTQLSPLAIPGAKPEAKPSLTWIEIPGKFPDGTAYSLRRPKLTLRDWSGEAPPADLPISLRLAPAVFGGGLLESIPQETLEKWADPDDADHDGISGRPNQGRFGWKANARDLADQTSAAFLLDMGLLTKSRPTGDLTAPQEKEKELAALPNGGDPEVSDLIFARIVHYLRVLAPPAPRPAEPAGRQLLQHLQCAKCHQPEAKTATSPPATLPELSQQTFFPYTDLLLHDMGPDLADGRPDGLATGSEWRTPPLWGLGLHEIISGPGQTALLHDGRARNPTEAILWHGGEAEGSREAFKKLTAAERETLLRFLGTL